MDIDVIFEFWQSLLMVYAAVFVAFMSPGPNFVAISSRAVESRIAGVGVAMGISAGTAVWALFAATGVTAILSNIENSTSVVGVLGGAYLCWLGYKSARSISSAVKFSTEPQNEPIQFSPLSALKTGLLIQLSNPKTALFWLAIAPLVIRPETPAIIIFILVFGCLMIAILWHVLLAIAFSSGPVRTVYLNFKPKISMAFSVFFIGFGLRLIYDALTGIL